MSLPPSRISSFLLILVSLCSLSPLLALESDSRQEISWSADGGSTLRMEGNSQIWELNDNVNVTQGSLKISGNQAIIELDAETNELIRVTVNGSPVNYQQQLDDSGAMVIGSSLSIEFYRDSTDQGLIIDLIGDARIASPDTTMNCAAITYLADRDLIREAQGPCQGSLIPNPN